MNLGRQAITYLLRLGSCFQTAAATVGHFLNLEWEATGSALRAMPSRGPGSGQGPVP